MPTVLEPQLPPPKHHRTRLSTAGRFFAGYAWLILKNLIGWSFILISPAIGFTVPGPGGIPIFLIGFALVTFPGKRKLTSRVMRGRGLPLEMQIFTFATAFIAILVTCGLMYFLVDKIYDALESVKSVDLDPRKQ